jgi:hypothetical protein
MLCLRYFSMYSVFNISYFGCLESDSSVGIMTGYGLKDRGSNPGRNKIFPLSTTSKPSLGPTQPLSGGCLGSFPGGKAAEV